MNFNSLRVRVLSWFAVVLFVIVGIFSFLLYHYFNKSINEKIKTELYHKALSIQNKLLANQPIQDKTAIIIKNKNISSSFNIVDKGEYLNATYILKINKPFNATIKVYKNNIDDKVEDLIDSMLFLDPLLLIILLIAGWKLIDKILIPLKETTKIAKQININDLSNTLSIPLPKYDDEIKELVISFNEMVRRLKEGVENIDRFNSDVSHELRTPITVIKGEIEIANMKTRDTKYYKNSIQTISLEIEKINSIVKNLLLLTKYSKDNIFQTFTNINLNNLLLDIIDKFEQKLKQKTLNLKIQNFENATLKANKTLVGAIFSNLLDNAIKYSTNSKNIYISLTKNEFMIKDEGIGIDKKDLSKITQRFYRADTSRNKYVEGFGLGLSIVQNSVKLHEWHMKIFSFLHKGTTVKIFF